MMELEVQRVPASGSAVSLRALWRFGRPHTIIGSVVSISTLYVIVCDRSGSMHWVLLGSALVIGVACNLFIVGINQLADVELDRINKPQLPLPAGELSMAQGWAIVHTSLVVSLLLAMVVSPYLFGVVALAAFIGWAYSMPPLHLKQHHFTAALSISTVRGVLINLGGFMVYDHVVNGTVAVPMPVWILTVFIIAFSITIAWFKDVPDVKGDARYRIHTLALVYSPKVALIAGHVLVGSAYAFTIAAFIFGSAGEGCDASCVRILLYGHVVLFLLFLTNAIFLRADEVGSVRRFYQRFWLFFFAEYVLYLVAYLV